MWTFTYKHETRGSRSVADTLQNTDIAKVIQGNTWYFAGRQPGISEKVKQAEFEGRKIELVEILGDKTVSKLHLRFFLKNDDTLEVDNFGASTSTGTSNVKTLTRWTLNATDARKLFLILGKNLFFKFKWTSNDEPIAKKSNGPMESGLEVQKPNNISALKRKSYKTDISSLIDFDFTPRDIEKDKPKVDDIKDLSSLQNQDYFAPAIESNTNLPRKTTKLGKPNNIMSLFDDIDVTPVDIKRPSETDAQSASARPDIQSIENRKTPPLVLAERQELKRKKEQLQQQQQQQQQQQRHEKDGTVLSAEKNGTSIETNGSESLPAAHGILPQRDFLMHPITKFNKYDVDSPQVTAIRNLMQTNKQQENESFGVPVSEIKEDINIKPKVSGFEIDTRYCNSYLINKNKNWPARKNFKQFVKVLGKHQAAEQSIRDTNQHETKKLYQETAWRITDQEFITVTPKFNDLDMVSNISMSKPARAAPSHSVASSKSASVNLETQSQREKRNYTTIAQPPKEVLNKKAVLFVENENENEIEIENMNEIGDKNRETATAKREPHQSSRSKKKIITNSDEESDAELLEILKSTGSNTKRRRLRTGMRGNIEQEAINNLNYMDSDSDLEEFHFAKKPRSVRSSPVKNSSAPGSNKKPLKTSETTTFEKHNSSKTQNDSARRLTKRRKMVDDQLQRGDQNWSDEEEVFSFKT
ncbi:hypothetical protein ACO0RG_004065 [Hanseniaspora osmophila]|uniref:Uncharacterized protein n=1 Tax=Hanseniaspora osmophila TaxID=56408 RepID=A0A1E5RBQ3_9ASCO|nr:hypothetical protein AWRI3579_g2696 [Hanseniaspora osmophila]